MPSYATVRAIVRGVDPALTTLAHEGSAAFRDRFGLIHRHCAEAPNALWQADHTPLGDEPTFVLTRRANPGCRAEQRFQTATTRSRNIAASP